MAGRRPRVCLLVGGREGAGAAAIIEQLARGLDRRRFDVSGITCEEGPLADRIRSAGLEVEVLGTGWPPILREPEGLADRHRASGYLRLPGWIHRTRQALCARMIHLGVDLVHTSYLHFHLVGALAARWCDRSCVWHWHGVVGSRRVAARGGDERGGELRTGRDVRWRWIRLVAPMVRRGTVRTVWSIANSQVTAASVAPWTGDRRSVVYNGVEAVEGTAPGRLRSMLGLPVGSRIVGMVGSFNTIKGHLTFLEAAVRVTRNVPGVHFVHLGGQTAAKQESYHRRVLARRDELGLAGRVHFLGHRSDAAELTADFDVAAVCTLPPGEGFGMVIVEAMARRVPVIATSVGAAPEILSSPNCGVLIPPADPVALAAEVERLLGDEDLRRRIGEAGFRVCRERFSLEAMLRGVEQVYDRVLYERRVSSAAGASPHGPEVRGTGIDAKAEVD